MAEQFNPGNTVRLRSGGPTMTVQEQTDRGYLCVWFANRVEGLKREMFKGEMLEERAPEYYNDGGQHPPAPVVKTKD